MATPHAAVSGSGKELHCCNSTAKLLSRNTEMENMSDVPMRVDVIQQPGNVRVKRIELLPGQPKYMRYEDLSNRYNPGRPVTVEVYLREQGGRRILRTGDILDSKKVELNVSNGSITPTYTKGHIVGRLGLIIKLKQVAENIRSKLLKILGNRGTDWVALEETNKTL